MKKFFLLIFLLPSFGFGQTIVDYARFIERWEGRRNSVYVCPAGYKTIGVGHRIKSGENFSRLSCKQIDFLLLGDTLSAYLSAKRIIPEFDKLPHEVKLICVDMAFNLGENGFRKFKKAIAACNRHDWQTMAEELKNSKWYNQTGRRARCHVSTLGSL